MRPLLVALVYALFLCVASCPPDDAELAPVVDPLMAKFNNDICGQGIKPGGQADVKFLNAIILPYYISTKWLTKAPPAGWQKERDKILAKCHKNTYNYCDAVDRDKAWTCVKGMAGNLMLKYGSTAMAYCPILDKKIANWNTSGDRDQAFKFITQYCKTKGKVC